MMLPRFQPGSARSGSGSSQRNLNDDEQSYGTYGDTEKLPLPMGSEIRSQDWMSSLDDDTPLSAITIPGTHDSAAYTKSYPFVRTQRMTIIQQLDSGIRYFDLRCGIRNNVVELVHGVSYLGLRLENVLDSIHEWLSVHTREALIIQIKQDRGGRKSDVDFANAISQVLVKTPHLWRTANTTPSVGDLRGRIQLFRRFVGPSLYAYGIDVSEWQDNPSEPFTLDTLSGVQITIQDHYAFPSPTPLPAVIARKGGDVAGLLKIANEDMDSHHWYLNFTSAFELNFVYRIQPREIAVGGWWLFRWKPGINVRLRQYLRDAQGDRRRYGIVAMDFPEQGAEDLIAALFTSNFSSTREYSQWQWRSLLAMMMLMLVLLILWLYARKESNA